MRRGMGFEAMGWEALLGGNHIKKTVIFVRKTIESNGSNYPQTQPDTGAFVAFFSERNVNEQETQELQKLIAHYYAQKADQLMEDIWQEKNLSEAKMLEIVEQDLKKWKPESC